MIYNGLEKLVFDQPERCDECGGNLEYKGIGRYLCLSCGKELLDDYGKIKEYFRLHGSASLMDVVRDTGISKEKVKLILNGRADRPSQSLSYNRDNPFAANFGNYSRYNK